MKIAIHNGRVFDPANGAHGEIKSLYIDEGQIVAPGRDFQADRTIDASGRVIMPGAVDIHCHIAGPAVNRSRRLGAGLTTAPGGPRFLENLLPPAESIGLRYSLLGYTTAIEAAIAPSGARHCHAEFNDTPNIDRGFLLLLANHELLLRYLERGELELARNLVAWLLRQAGAFGIKAVNPGGVTHWLNTGGTVNDFSAPLPGRNVSPRQIVEFLADAAEYLQLPHAVHVHPNGLGTPGNIAITLATCRALAGRRHHLAHVQFHCYGQDAAGDFTSAAAQFVEHLAVTPSLTADVGQVMFGEALTLTADAEVEHFLWKLTGKPYVNVEVDLETGCGIVPIEYRHNSRLHTLQWLVGLELFLLSPDPWRLVMSTDHPNGGSFLAYPTLIAQLMDRNVRQRALDLADPRAVEASPIRGLDREYTLSEIAIITRAAPARILGLTQKGHLGPGADADVAIYNDQPDREVMFRWPYLVLQRGQLVAEDGDVRAPRVGNTLCVQPELDEDAARRVRQALAEFSTYDPRQMGLAGMQPAGLTVIGR